MCYFKVIVLVFCLFSPSGCAYFDGVGYFHSNQELFDAKIKYNLYTTMAAIEISNAEGLLCTGAALTTHSTKSYFSCMGAQGNFFMSCNDGRHLMAKWSADTCSSGQAMGSDQYGNTFVASFGESKAEMHRRVGTGTDAGKGVSADEGAGLSNGGFGEGVNRSEGAGLSKGGFGEGVSAGESKMHRRVGTDLGEGTPLFDGKAGSPTYPSLFLYDNDAGAMPYKWPQDPRTPRTGSEQN